VAPNCSFEVEDFEVPWTYVSHEAFDFMHARSLVGSVTSWLVSVYNAHTQLKPGGWIEIKQNISDCCSNVDLTLALSPPIRQGKESFAEACARIGKRVDIADELEA